MIEFHTTHPGPRPNLDAYEEIYRTTPIRQMASFYRWALHLTDARPGQRLLDVSCGVGSLVDLAARRGIDATGIDLASAAIIAGKRAGARGDLLVGNAEALPFPSDSFDHVVNLGSLEHYDHLDRGAAEMARVLRPDGKAVILVPNGFGYLHVLYVWRRGCIFDDGQPLQRYGTQADWRQALERNGFRVRRIVKSQYVPPYTTADLLWYLRHPLKLLQLVATPLIPLNAVGFFIFICEKNVKPDVFPY